MSKFHRWEDFLNSSIDAWQYHFLGELFSNRQEKNRPELPLLAVMGASGVIDRDKLERRDTSNADKSKYLRVATGDIVYNTMRMWQGVSGSAHKDGIVSPAYTVATPTNLLDKKFAKYLVKNELLIQKFHQNSQGLVNDTLNLKFPNFASIHVQVPPLPEQKKIASILTSVDEVIKNTQRQVDKLQDLKKATMKDLLTRGIGHREFKDSELGRIPKSWKCGELGDLADRIEGGGTPSRTVPEYWKGDIPWSTVKDLVDTYLGSTEETITELGLNQSSSRLIPSGTIILATRMAVGKAVVFNTNVAINQDLKAFFHKPIVDPKFLLQLFLSKSSYLETLATGSTVKGIRLKELRAIPVKIPPLPEQRKIASILISIDEVIKTRQSKLEKVINFKKSLMQDLLTGKVRVQVN